MLTFETKRLLAEMFKKIAESENQVEDARLTVSELSLFCPYESFRRIDRYSSGEVSTEDVITFCSDNGVYCSFSDAVGLIAQYDENGNGRLSFDEYLQLVLPATSPSLRSLATSRDTSAYAPRRAFLNSDVEFHLSRVF